MGIPEDAADLLAELEACGAEFVVVGAHALAAHGYVRGTADFNVFVRAGSEQAARVHEALQRFGAPVRAHGLTVEDLAREGTVYQIGLPPRRIDVLTSISGVSFDEAWASRVVIESDGLVVGYLGLDELIAHKRACGRAQDVADVERLEALRAAGGRA